MKNPFLSAEPAGKGEQKQAIAIKYGGQKICTEQETNQRALWSPIYPQAVQTGPEQAMSTPQMVQVQLGNSYQPTQDPAHTAPLTMEQDTATQTSSSTDTSGHDDLAFIANPDAFGEDPAYPR